VTVFAAVINDFFADANLAQDALHRVGGKGSPLPVRIILRQPYRIGSFGQELYAKQEPRRFERGTDLHTQSNPLPMTHRPAVLVKLVAS